MALNVIRQEDAADLSGGASVFWDLSAVDLSGRIPAAGIRNREIYGLWLHGGHDAEQNVFLHVISGIHREPSIITMAGSILQCFLRSLQEAEWK